jgi:6-phosphogluconolactonase
MAEVGMMSSNLHRFDSSDKLTQSLSESIIKNLQDEIDKSDKASLIVSGGSTPKALFKKLRVADIEWEKVSIALCDERWVKSDNSDSNERLIREYLLQERASKAQFIGMYVDGLKPTEAELTCKKKMSALMPFSVVVLGMGADAHTASLFPNNPRLKEAFDMDSDKLCIAITPEHAPHQRMSLTRKAILGAKSIYLHIEGEEKLKVFDKVMAGDDIFSMPIRSILHQDKKEIEVYYA